MKKPSSSNHSNDKSSNETSPCKRGEIRSPTTNLRHHHHHHHRRSPPTSTTINDQNVTAASIAAAAAWSSQTVAAAYHHHHHMYPNSYSPNQNLFYSTNTNSTETSTNPYRTSEMDFFQPTSMYGRPTDEFIGSWPTAHQNFKIFN